MEERVKPLSDPELHHECQNIIINSERTISKLGGELKACTAKLKRSTELSVKQYLELSSEIAEYKEKIDALTQENEKKHNEAKEWKEKCDATKRVIESFEIERKAYENCIREFSFDKEYFQLSNRKLKHERDEAYAQVEVLKKKLQKIDKSSALSRGNNENSNNQKLKVPSVAKNEGNQVHNGAGSLVILFSLIT